MPNIKSASKRLLTSKKQRDRNKQHKTLLKTNLKKFNLAIAEGNREAAEEAYKVAVKTTDKAVSKGLIHKNNAARKKSSLTRHLKELA
jgi:small subunit ribosomal protein S20